MRMARKPERVRKESDGGSTIVVVAAIAAPPAIRISPIPVVDDEGRKKASVTSNDHATNHRLVIRPVEIPIDQGRNVTTSKSPEVPRKRRTS
jgi:hypothetical protein